MTWGRIAETSGEYLKKGHPVYVAGQLRTDKYEPREGGTKYFTKVNVREMVLLSGGRGGGGGDRPRQQPKDYADAKGKDYSPPPQGDFDDDIPF